MATENVSRKSLINAFCTIVLTNEDNAATIAASMNATPEAVKNAAEQLYEANNRVHVRKPSAETIRNHVIMGELVEELNARGKEMTAAEIADVYTDPDGMTLNPRKVGGLLARAAREGLIAKSPYSWSVAHYAPLGVAFKEKPTRKTKKNSKDTTPEDTKPED
nr:MAG TPA: Z DNA-binding protein [Caudoviricetes sp.]